MNYKQQKNQKKKKPLEEMLIFLAIKEMQIKTMLRFHLTPVRMATINNATINVGEAVRKKEPSYTAGRTVN
jgi:hypothetical protein